MRRLGGRLIWICFALVATFSTATPARAEGCRRIRATIDLGQGTIRGNFGLDGTVAFTQDSPGTPPPTAPAGSTVFSGLLLISTDRGTLQVRETGMFSQRTRNAAGPVLSSWGDSPSGTGFYQGVTGDLFFLGQRNAEGLFRVKVRGELCPP